MFEISYTGKTWYEITEQAARDLVAMEYQNIDRVIESVKGSFKELEIGNYAPCFIRYLEIDFVQNGA